MRIMHVKLSEEMVNVQGASIELWKHMEHCQALEEQEGRLMPLVKATWVQNKPNKYIL